MKKANICITMTVLGLILCSCGGSGSSSPAPSTMEVIRALEVEVNEQDLEGVMALFAEDAVWEESYQDRTFEGSDNIAWGWEVYFMTPITSEFRDISVDGDNATFTWVEFRPSMNKIWPTIIQVTNGKITFIEWPEEPTRESTELE